MKTFTKIIGLMLLTIAAILFIQPVSGQSVLNPDDPTVTYNPATPPVQPAFGQIGKWVRTKRLNWNTDAYKCYIYKGKAFRLKFPTTYKTAPAGTKFPMIIMFHGAGEAGPITDNEYQLYHGGDVHLNAVNNGTFDGFVLFMQTGAGWAEPMFAYHAEIIDYMVANNNLDPFRVSVHGLSFGGAGAWLMAAGYPKYIASTLPMSNATVGWKDDNTFKQNIKWLSTWNFQGGLDGSPDPNTTAQVGAALLAVGANYKYTLYPDLGHGTWDRAYAEPDFFPFINRANKANPWTLFGRTEFCPGDPINLTIGVTAGFNAYEWRKNGVLIPGATSNQINVTTIGTYDCRVLRGSTWSSWSPIPAVIKIKTPTVSPAITVSGVASKVIPATDEKTSVQLEVPAGYASYLWQKGTGGATLSTTRFLTATTPGDYRVRVTEQFGCSSDFSAPFTVIDANGPNKPDAAINLAVSTLSKTSLKLDWSDNPAPAFNETNFEVYQASQAGGPYTFIGSTGADVLTRIVTGLNAKTRYYYRIRAVNLTGAAAASAEASGTTDADLQAPTAPINLTVSGSTRNSISISWGASTDDVGVTYYDVYINGRKSFTTQQTQFTVYNLENGNSYNFTVKARDFANNSSPASNQVTGQPLMNGLNYKHYTFTGNWSNLPDFNTLTPVATGIMPNVAITPRVQDDNFAFLWEGNILIPTTGTYYFRTNSDDGSRLWLGARNGTSSPYSFAGAPTVNNDGLHGGQDATSVALNLTAGVYPIAAAFFEQGGGEAMTVSWRTPASGTNFVTIPNSSFADVAVVNGQAPATPTNLKAVAAAYNKITLSWNDNSNNETGFEVWRSSNSVTGFNTVGVAPGNATSFTDSLALSPSTTYYYKIKAIGQYGESPFSSQGSGINYSYYEQTGLNNLPDFNALTPVKTGRQATFGLGAQNRGDNFQFKFDGFINITTGGVYTFYTTSDDGSKLYIDGFDAAHQVVNNDFLQGPTERSGTVNLTPGSHAIYATFFESGGGEFFEVRYQGPVGSGVAKQLIPSSVLGEPLPNATTLGLPTAPSAPTNFVAASAGTSAINLSWTDNANNEDAYEVYRSANNNSNYVLLKSLPVNAVSYKDSSLFANATYFYKVRSVNVGGPSAYTNEASAITNGPTNNPPVITAIPDQFMRFGTQLQITVQATDADLETLTFQLSNHPAAYTSLVANGGNSAIITFSPTIADLGVVNGITITVNDQNGGSASTSFNLTVSDNYNPVVTPISNVTLSEKQSSQINISATDQNAGDVLSWTFTGLPDFVTSTINGGSVQLNLTPSYADNGVYNVSAKAQDQNGGFDIRSFVITVNDVNPNKKVYIDFTAGGFPAPAPWNMTTKAPAQNDNYPSLKDANGVTTSIGFQITSPWQTLGPDATYSSNSLGANTGNNSGVYPDNVMQTAFYTTAPTQTIRVYGLDVANKYKFTFFGSRGSVSDNRTTNYTIGSTTVSLNAAGNTQNTISINLVQPQPDGSLVISMQKAAASSYGYLNAMVIESTFDDGTVPAKARNLAAQLVNNQLAITWVDAAYNETAYQLYRSTSQAGPYTLLTPGGNNPGLQSYNDPNIIGNTTYYYYVTSTNSYGTSPSSDTLAFTTPNTAPIIAAVTDKAMKINEVLDVNVSATDQVGDVVSLQVTGLPSFATFINNGNGTGTIRFAPGATTGTFSGITVTASDDKGANTSLQFKLTVSVNGTNSIYVNFNSTLPVGAPWNSTNSLPIAGLTLSGLRDETGTVTGVGITLVDGWENANDLGASTANNSGVFPDDVMKTAYFESSTNTKRFRVTGLTAPNAKYKLKFFASRSSVSDNRNTTFTVGTQSVTLNAAGNTTNTVQITGISPNGSGVIEFTARKTSSASVYAYINALVIEPDIDNGVPPVIPTVPVNFKAVGKTKTSIQLNWTNVASGQTGVEIYRASSLNGTYSLLTNLGGAVSSYTDATGLVANTQYWYKLRAVIGATYSDYTIATGSTVSYQVYVNFNKDNPAGSPWNNTNNLPQDGSVYPLANDLNNPTGISLEVVGNTFAGENPFGMNTGNNSGIYPDNVVRSTWWLDAGNTAQIRITGLNQSMAYNFVFFASRDGGGTFADRTSIYTIGNKSTSLNAINNISQTAQVNTIIPDENGSALISINAGGASPYAYIGALVIQGYPLDTTGVPSAAGSSVTTSTVELARVNTQGNTEIATAATVVRDNSVLVNKVSAYPNPFTDDVTLNISLERPMDKMNILVTDITGRTIYSKVLNNIPQGMSQQKLGINGQSLLPGVYLVHVHGLPGEKVKVIKLLK